MHALHIKDGPGGRGRPRCQVNGHADGTGRVIEGIEPGAAVDQTGDAPAGEHEPVAVRATHEVLDPDEGVTVQRPGARAGEDPRVRRIAADQGVVARATREDAAQAAPGGPFEGVGGGPAGEVLDARERLTVQCAGIGAVDDPCVGRVGANQRVAALASRDDTAQAGLGRHDEGVRTRTAFEVLDPAKGDGRKVAGLERTGVGRSDRPDIAQVGSDERVVPGAADHLVHPAERAVATGVDDGPRDRHVPVRSQADGQVARLFGEVEDGRSRLVLLHRCDVRRHRALSDRRVRQEQSPAGQQHRGDRDHGISLIEAE